MNVPRKPAGAESSPCVGHAATRRFLPTCPRRPPLEALAAEEFSGVRERQCLVPLYEFLTREVSAPGQQGVSLIAIEVRGSVATISLPAVRQWSEL